VLVLAGAAAAVAAATGAYRGTTSQNRAVSFTLLSRGVTEFKIVVLDKCPDGHTLKVTGQYPSMTIRSGSFGGRFVPVGGHRGETATLQGKVGRSKVTGTLKDTSFSKQERRLCHGSASFSAKHVVKHR
jgi:hypothetical protein